MNRVPMKLVSFQPKKGDWDLWFFPGLPGPWCAYVGSVQICPLRRGWPSPLAEGADGVGALPLTFLY